MHVMDSTSGPAQRLFSMGWLSMCNILTQIQHDSLRADKDVGVCDMSQGTRYCQILFMALMHDSRNLS